MSPSVGPSPAPGRRPGAHGPESLVGSVVGFATCAAPFVLAVRESAWLLVAPVAVAGLAVGLVCLPSRRRLGLGLLAGSVAFALSGLALLVLFLVALTTSGPPVPPAPG